MLNQPKPWQTYPPPLPWITQKLAELGDTTTQTSHIQTAWTTTQADNLNDWLNNLRT